MLKSKKSKIIILTIIFLFCSKFVLADDINTGVYNQIYNGGSQSLKNAGELILGLVQAIGTSVAVIMIVIIAIKYFISAPDQKADVKSKLIPYVIGAVLLFGASNILGIVVRAVKEIFK